ncbi:MAG: radical SAM protein [Patescibacteria group bacterium]|nr:radical SAM protein [Patescibacteria group bacterium]
MLVKNCKTEKPPMDQSSSPVYGYFTNKQLSLVILPTEQCNFRCRYCYENFAIGKMKPEIIFALKKFLSFRLPTLDVLNLDWFGGEPLLAYDVIIDIMSFLQKQAQITNPNLCILSGMSTNGSLLTMEKLQKLTTLNVKTFQISFDGAKDQHDKLRVNGNGEGTFDSIWKNLIYAHKSDLDFHISIRLHINVKNQNSAADLLGQIARELENDSRFTVYIRRLGQSQYSPDSPVGLLQIKDPIIQLRKTALNLGLSLTKDFAEKSVCPAALPNSFIIRADGSINKCLLFLYHKENQIGKLNPDGTLELDSNLFSGWLTEFYSKNNKGLSCPAASMINESPLIKFNVRK